MINKITQKVRNKIVEFTVSAIGKQIIQFFFFFPIRETRKHVLIIFFFVFFTLSTATQTNGSINCKTNSLRYPFGLSEGYPIRFNCSETTGDAVIGEFAVEEVTNSNIYVTIPPLCEREIGKIEQLFRENLAPSNIQNIILGQGCMEQSFNCLIGNRFVEERLNLSRCKSQVSCLEVATTTRIAADVMSIGDVVNRSRCEFWFSSMTMSSELLVKLGRFKLEWWLKGSCNNANCSKHADCKDVKLTDGRLGHRCACRKGFSGDAFTVPGSCHRLGSLPFLTYRSYNDQLKSHTWLYQSKS